MTHGSDLGLDNRNRAGSGWLLGNLKPLRVLSRGNDTSANRPLDGIGASVGVCRPPGQRSPVCLLSHGAGR
jgi:hypothetical protein